MALSKNRIKYIRSLELKRIARPIKYFWQKVRNW